MSWEEITKDPEFQALNPDLKQKVLRGWYRDNVASDPEYQKLATEQKFEVMRGHEIDAGLYSKPEPISIKDALFSGAKQFGREIAGTGEAVANIAGGAVAFPVHAGIALGAGAGTLLRGGTIDEAAQNITGMQELVNPYLVYQPQTAEGKRNVENVGKGLEFAIGSPSRIAGEYTQKGIEDIGLGQTAGAIGGAGIQTLTELVGYAVLLGGITGGVKKLAGIKEPIQPRLLTDKDVRDFKDFIEQEATKRIGKTLKTDDILEALRGRKASPEAYEYIKVLDTAERNQLARQSLRGAGTPVTAIPPEPEAVNRGMGLPAKPKAPSPAEPTIPEKLTEVTGNKEILKTTLSPDQQIEDIVNDTVGNKVLAAKGYRQKGLIEEAIATAKEAISNGKALKAADGDITEQAVNKHLDILEKEGLTDAIKQVDSQKTKRFEGLKETPLTLTPTEQGQVKPTMPATGELPLGIGRTIPEGKITREGKAVAGKPKEAWEMTQDEFVKNRIKPTTNVYGKGGIKYAHESLVKQALSEGKPIPAEVLKDYPDLQKPEAPKGEVPVKTIKPIEAAGQADIEVSGYGITPDNRLINVPQKADEAISNIKKFKDSITSYDDAVNKLPNEMKKDMKGYYDTSIKSGVSKSKAKNQALKNIKEDIADMEWRIQNQIDEAMVKQVEPVVGKPIPEELEPLAEEARKYKTAEEFVRNQIEGNRNFDDLKNEAGFRRYESDFIAKEGMETINTDTGKTSKLSKRQAELYNMFKDKTYNQFVQIMDSLSSEDLKIRDTLDDIAIEPGKERIFYRTGRTPLLGKRSYNYREQKSEKGSSVYFYPSATSFAGLASNKWFYGKGRQIAWGSDDEPVIIPTGEWKPFKIKTERQLKNIYRRVHSDKPTPVTEEPVTPIAEQSQVKQPQKETKESKLKKETEQVSKKVDDYIGEFTPSAGMSIKDISGIKPTNDNILSPGNIRFENIEAEAAWQNAKGIGRPSLYQKAVELAVNIKNSFAKKYPLLDSKTDGAVIDTLRVFEATPEIAKEKTLHILQGITAGLGKNKYDVFTKDIILSDLIESVRNGLYEEKNLPFKFKNLAELKKEHGKVKSIVEANPDIKEAIERRQGFVNALTQELVDKGFLPEEVLQNKSYYHRQVLDYIRAKEAYTGTSSIDVRTHGKGWQKKRAGSELDYNTQYLEAEFEVISQSLSLLKTQETLQKLEGQGIDIAGKLKQQAAEKGIENWKSLIPDDYVIWQPKKGNNFYKATTIHERILDEVLSGAKELSDADLKEVLAVGRKKQEWVIPKRMAKTFDNLKDFEDKTTLHAFNDTLLISWKQWALLNPVRVIKYNLNNLSGDFDITFAYNPKILKYTPAAIKELFSHVRGKSMSQDMVDFNERAGLSSGMTIREIPDITEQGVFKLLTGDNPNLIERGWKTVKDYTQFRENILRLAAYKFFKAERAAGKSLYGVSKKTEIDAMIKSKADPLDIDAKLARELIGDYGNISEAGNYIRQHLIPFYSWMEINTPRYVRLFKNAAYEDRGVGGTAGRVAGVAAKKGAFATAKAAAKLIPTTVAFYTLVELWNKTMFPEEDKQLSDAQRKQKHLIIGKREDGTMQTIRLQGALSDMLEWVGAADIPNDIADIMQHGISSLKDKAKEVAISPLQKIANSIWPLQKVVAEVAIGKTLYPDVFNPRPIRDSSEHIARFLSVDLPYKYITGKPTRGISQDMQNVITYTTDVGESAYHDTMALVKKYREQNKIEKPAVESTGKSNALYYLKQAVKFKDKEAVEKYVKMYNELGGTAKGFVKSLEMANPLYGLPPQYLKIFIDTLSPEEKERVIRGVDWYMKTYLNKKSDK